MADIFNRIYSKIRAREPVRHLRAVLHMLFLK